jgi:hypothetical protein
LIYDGIRKLRLQLAIPSEVELQWSPKNGSWLKTEQGNAIRDVLRRQMRSLAAVAGMQSVSVV